MQTVLLGMDDRLAGFFQPAIQDNTNQLQVLNQTVSRMHDISAALAKYNPDILLVASEHLSYDTDNYQNELVNGLYQITQDPRFSAIRIALITDERSVSRDTLSRLAVFVRDIFLTEPGTGRLDLQQLTEQLARPANVQNVAQFLGQVSPNLGNSQQVPPQQQYSQYNNDPYGSSNSNQQYQNQYSYTSNTPPRRPTPANGDEVENLKKLVELYKTQLEMQKRQNQGDFVPKEDYDNLLSQARAILDQGSNDQQIKDLFQQVINSNTGYSGKLHEANDMIAQQNELINELSEKVSNLENNEGNSQEVQSLKRQLAEAHQQINNSNGNYDNIPEGSYRKAPNRPRPPRPNRDPQSNYNRPRPPRPNDRNRNYNPKNAKLPAPINRPGIKKKKQETFLTKLLANKTLLIGIGGGLVLLILLLVVVFNRPNDSNSGVSSTQSSSTLSFDNYIKKGQYSDAAQAYPARAVEAENKMLEDPDVTSKETFTSDILKVSDKDPIKFDNYYFKQDYGKAVDLLKSSNDSDLKNLSDARRVMAAYSYMKDGQISKAESTAKPLKNKTLNERIKVYKEFQDSNDKLNEKINSGNLSNSEKKKAQKTIKENKEKMNKL